MPDSISNIMNSLGEMTPFITMVAGRPQINTSKIMEALIIGVILAVATRFIIIAEMKIELQHVQSEMVEMKGNYKDGLAEIKAEIKTIKGDIYIPKFDVK